MERGERRKDMLERKNSNSMKMIERLMNNNVSWINRQSNEHKERNDKIVLTRIDKVTPDSNACCRSIRSNKMKCQPNQSKARYFGHTPCPSLVTPVLSAPP